MKQETYKKLFDALDNQSHLKMEVEIDKDAEGSNYSITLYELGEEMPYRMRPTLDRARELFRLLDKLEVDVDVNICYHTDHKVCCYDID
jgi:hypothetical protein